ncbi:MAG: hypothetical protein QY329_08475 [Anaerolineales bacterium]|nr:MAG: hypothetical protein QY329_08475 [Anaerolineales bacterium]
MPDCAGGVALEPFSDYNSKKEIREWWRRMVQGKDSLVGRRDFYCYGIFLAFPSDSEAIRYLIDFGNDAEIASGEDSLIISLSTIEFRQPGFNSRLQRAFEEGQVESMKFLRSQMVNDYVFSGYGIQIAKLFEIDIVDFPCLLIFSDIRSPEHFVVSLKGLTAEGIAEHIRTTFSVIHKAKKDKKDFFAALEHHKNATNFQKSGKSILTKVSGVAGKTFETAISVLLNSLSK